MGYAFLNEGSLATCNTPHGVPSGTPYVEFERGSLPADPETLTIVDGVIVIDTDKQATYDSKLDKADRLAQLDELTVTTTSGKVFDADKPAREAMTTAVVMGEAGMSTPWKMADNTIAVITWEEMKEALMLVAAAQTALIAVV